MNEMLPMNSRNLADAVAYGVLSLLHSNKGQGDYHVALLELSRSIDPRFKQNFLEAVGRAEKYSLENIEAMKSDLESSTLIDLLSRLSLQNLDNSQIKTTGTTYTPIEISRYITRNAVRWWKKQNPTKASPELIGDFSAGVGSFLLALHLEGIGSDSRIIGVDSNLYSVLCCEILRISLGANWELYCADSLLDLAVEKDLFSNDSELDEIKFDLLLGNPPYVRASNLQSSYVSELRRKYPSIKKGTFDISVAFLEQATMKLKPNGVFSYITSSKFSDSVYGEQI